ncbi:MAG: DegV family protein [Candidatus Atribacteria bacterium]|nr:MAG: DegV family protein [Candidatus Atribacteria bacterium]
MSTSRGSETRVLNQESLRELIMAGAHRVIAHREHLDRINVFPVPDKDTGTNLAMTMRAVLEGLRQPLPSLAAVSSTVATSALTGAQGNSGVIFAQFFQGLREEIADSVQLSMQRFAEALRSAAVRAREALAQPREGTILTVISDVADHLVNHAERLPDFKALLDEGLSIARRSLEMTTERLAELKRAGVVDAGALGFVHFLEGIRDFFHSGVQDSDSFELSDEEKSDAPKPAPVKISFRYCTEAVVWGEDIDRTDLLRRLSDFGDSVVVAGDRHEIHAHVHTNAPAYVLELLSQVGTIASQKVEDMLASIGDTDAASDLSGREGIALVTDSACDLPMQFLTQEHIHVVPVQIVFGDESLLDRVDITPTQFYKRLQTAEDLPKTSQPKPIDFLTLYRHLATTYSSILSVHLSAELSGTWQSANVAAKQVSRDTGVPIAVLDSRSASAAEGLVMWATAQAAKAGLSAAECTAIANRAAKETSTFVYVPSIEYFVRGGRVSPLQGRVAKLLHLLPVLTVTDGNLVPAAKILGKRAARKRVLQRILKAARSMQRPMFVISHSAALDLATQVQAAILNSFSEAIVWITDTTPAIGSHAGPGGLGIAVLDTGWVEERILKDGAA